MANTTFNGPVRSENGFQSITINGTTGAVTVDAIFDQSVWDRQLAEDVRPVLAGIINDASGMLAEKADRPVAIANDEYYKTLDAQTERVQKVNDTTKEDLIAAIISAQALDGSEDEKSALLRAAIIAVFVAAIMKRRQRIAEIEAQSAFNGGMYLGVPFRTRLWNQWRADPDAVDPAGQIALAADPDDVDDIDPDTVRHLMVVHHDDPVNKYAYSMVVQPPLCWANEYTAARPSPVPLPILPVVKKGS